MLNNTARSFTLFQLLVKLKVLKIVGYKRHTISHAITVMNNGNVQHLVSPHWIPLAVSDLSLEFMEIIF
jgi:hypothetical protein